MKREIQRVMGDRSYSYFARSAGESIASSMERREIGATPFGGGEWRFEGRGGNEIGKSLFVCLLA